MRDKVKILEWSERGFRLHYFRLEEGKLPWPQEGEEFNPLDITWQDLRWLLEGTALRPFDKRRVNPPNAWFRQKTLFAFLVFLAGFCS